MLQSLRTGSKSPFMKVFLVFLAGGFAIWGIGDVSTGLFGPGNKAIKAGAKSLSAVEVAQEFDFIRRSQYDSISTGDAIEFGIVLSSASKQPQKLMIDFAVHHQKSNGSMTPKVFKWKTVTLQPSSTETLSKSHLFKAITTRKYYAGEHAIEVLVNGVSVGKASFELVMD